MQLENDVSNNTTMHINDPDFNILKNKNNIAVRETAR